MEYFSILLCLVITVFSTAAVFEKSKCKCPLIYSPVCGSDNKDYDNACLLACAAESEKKPSELKLNFHGPCNSNEQVVRSLSFHEKRKICTCPTEEDEPVCDSNGKTHLSECHFKCHRPKGVKIVREGACEIAAAPASSVLYALK